MLRIQNWFRSRSIFDFWSTFGPILGPKWAKFSTGISVWKRYRLQRGLQRPFGPHLGPFKERVGTIFGYFFANFGQNFDLPFHQNHVNENLIAPVMATKFKCSLPFLVNDLLDCICRTDSLSSISGT